MRRRFFTQSRVFAFAVVLTVVGCLLPASVTHSLADRPRHLLITALLPLHYPLKRFSDGLTRPADQGLGLGTGVQLERNYLELLSLNAKLEQQLYQAQQAIEQLSQIRNLLQTHEQLLPARVTLASVGLDIKTLTLGRGSHHGVDQGMVVAAGANLVGRVSSVGPWTSTVRLITSTSPRTYLSVRVIPPLREASPRQWDAQLQVTDEGDDFVARGNQDAPVRVGDLAYLVDDRWPPTAQGLIVGRVTSIAPDAKTPLLRQQVTVTPLYALGQLGQVTVIQTVRSETSAEGGR